MHKALPGVGGQRSPALGLALTGRLLACKVSLSLDLFAVCLFEPRSTRRLSYSLSDAI